MTYIWVVVHSWLHIMMMHIHINWIREIWIKCVYASKRWFESHISEIRFFFFYVTSGSFVTAHNDDAYTNESVTHMNHICSWVTCESCANACFVSDKSFIRDWLYSFVYFTEWVYECVTNWWHVNYMFQRAPHVNKSQMNHAFTLDANV